MLKAQPLHVFRRQQPAKAEIHLSGSKEFLQSAAGGRPEGYVDIGIELFEPHHGTGHDHAHHIGQHIGGHTVAGHLPAQRLHPAFDLAQTVEHKRHESPARVRQGKARA